MIPLDSETLGLCGPMVLLQFQRPGEEITLYEVWKEPVGRTLDLFEELMGEDLVMFNAAFDHFQMCKIATMWTLFAEQFGRDCVPNTLWWSPRMLGEIEKAARNVDLTLRPRGIYDLQLWAQRGPYQMCMERDPITIRRLPELVATQLCNYLNDNVKFDRILFAKKANPDGPQWSVVESTNRRKEPIPGLYDVKCIFHPSVSLKTLVGHLGLIKGEAAKFEDVGAPFSMMPVEMPFAPYALAFENIEGDMNDDRGLTPWTMVKDFLVRKYNTKAILDKLALPFYGTWLHYGPEQIKFWSENERAREYASDDIVFTKRLWEHAGSPEFNDDDSVLATSVASARWKGFAIDNDGFKNLEAENVAKITPVPFFQKTAQCLQFLKEVMDPQEAATLGKQTDKNFLEKLENKAGGELGHRARLIMDARRAKKELELIWKLLIADRMHASFRVVGALSSRMSGSDGLNPMGIKRDKYIREKFPLAFPGFTAVGGDFAAFEVVLYIAVSKDKKLESDVLTEVINPKTGLKEKQKIHALFGTHCFPHMSYWEIVNNKDIYTRSKSGLFALIYGGNHRTLENRLSISESAAQNAYDGFLAAYPEARAERLRIEDEYSPVKESEDGRYIWTGFKPDVESLFGFKRRFDQVEFPAEEILFHIMMNLPHEITRIEGEFMRHPDMENPRLQNVSGLVMSALLGTCFGIQGAVQRQSNNHQIQSSGAQITKKLQRRIWDLQPIGLRPWVVQPMQVHDEILVVTRDEYVSSIERIKEELLDEMRSVVPLIDIEWMNHLRTWADK